MPDSQKEISEKINKIIELDKIIKSKSTNKLGFISSVFEKREFKKIQKELLDLGYTLKFHPILKKSECAGKINEPYFEFDDILWCHP